MFRPKSGLVCFSIFAFCVVSFLQNRFVSINVGQRYALLGHSTQFAITNLVARSDGTSATTRIHSSSKNTTSSEGDEESIISAVARQSHHPPTRPRAILHVGPKKTGTTSIQSWLSSNPEILAADGWHWVPFVGHPVRFLHSSHADVEKTFANKNFSTHMAIHAQQGHNIIVSHEFLAIIPRESMLVWKRLKELLDSFDVSIIFTYRRLYDWLLSNHADDSKTDSPNFPISKNFRELLESKIRAGNDPSPKLAPTAHDPFRGPQRAVHPVQAIAKLYREQGFSKITIINMHNTSDMLPTFVCEALGHTSNACNSLTSPNILRHPSISHNHNETTNSSWWRNSSSDEPSIHENVRSSSWEYHRLGRAVMASFANITANSQRYSQWAVSMGQAICRRQEQDLNLTLRDFPQICATPEQLDMLLRTSLEMERDVFPEFYATPAGQGGLRKHFQSLVEMGAFCNVRVEDVVKDPDWSTFGVAKLNQLQQHHIRWLEFLSHSTREGATNGELSERF